LRLPLLLILSLPFFPSFPLWESASSFALTHHPTRHTHTHQIVISTEARSA
jgi:hypothetical protein